MPIESRYMAVVDLLMRVPSLLLIDSVLNKSLLPLILSPEMFESETPWLSFKTVFCMIILILCFTGALLMFFMTTEQLILTYNFTLSVVMIYISYVWNRHMVLQLGNQDDPHKQQTSEIQKGSWFYANVRTFVLNVLLQIGLAFNFNSLRIDQVWFRHDVITSVISSSLNSITYFSLLFPTVSKLCMLPNMMLYKTPVVSLMLPIMELSIFVFTKLKNSYQSAIETYNFNRLMIQSYGIQGYIESQWIRINVPDVLRVFWITRFMCQAVSFVLSHISENQRMTGEPYLSFENITVISRDLLVNGCDTVVALLGMTSVVSIVTQNIGLFFAAYIGSENEEGQNMGTVSAILFFILALQTGLTGLSPEMRLWRLFRNFCLLSTAILHFVHSMVNPILMSLSASRNTAVNKHFRALSMCVFLVLFPLLLLNHLWQHYPASTWLMAVSAFSVEVVIKVFISLMIYLLFMIDAYQDTFWEALDDYVYYLKASGSSIEFLFGIFLFGNGFWIMVFESGGTIRAIMMCIHAYFNIWVQAKEGWKVFKRRQTAVNKINSLPYASSEQIDSHNDVCAICYQDLQTARITRCNHFFHGVCLRKWLYVQDRCPLCHEVIYLPEDLTDSTTDEIIQNNNHENYVANGVHRRRNQNNEVLVNDFDNQGVHDHLD